MRPYQPGHRSHERSPVDEQKTTRLARPERGDGDETVWRHHRKRPLSMRFKAWHSAVRIDSNTLMVPRDRGAIISRVQGEKVQRHPEDRGPRSNIKQRVQAKALYNLSPDCMCFSK